jgi:hypothetical protein
MHKSSVSLHFYETGQKVVGLAGDSPDNQGSLQIPYPVISVYWYAWSSLCKVPINVIWF